jgi:hypothetical protein
VASIVRGYDGGGDMGWLRLHQEALRLANADCRWRVDGNGAEAYAEARWREREGPAVTWHGALHSNTIDLTNDLHRLTHAYSFRQRVQILRGQSCSHDGVEAIPSL